MNLLFYTDFKISPTKGGTEHTTLTVATQLHEKYGCKCWAFHSVDAQTPSCNCFEEQFFVKGKNLKEKLYKIISDNHIDVVLSEGGFNITGYVDELRKEHNLNIKNIFVHHFTPGWEENFGLFIGYLSNFNNKSGLRKIKALIKLILYPVFRHRYLSNLVKEYRSAYYSADKIVLLTKSYIQMYQEYGHFNDDKKFCVIPNALSLPDILNKEDYDSQKKKVVLVVARMEEVQKRISLVLRIWKEVHNDKRTKDWKLLIAGDGIYLNRYKSYAKENKLKNIEFLGRVNPVPYYREASIFMMTSKSEGFPLTLNEAMQYGVVPLAFDSFASIRDIINDSENGFIIPEMDMKAYSDTLLNLITDDQLRRNMAMNALDSCKRYLPERIGDMWWKLLNSF